MNFKKIALITSLAAISGMTNAATGEQVSQILTVTTTIPSTTFSVAPVTGAWPSTINLNYDEVSNKLSTYTLTLNAKYEAGLSALLVNNAELTSGTNTIPLNIKLDSKALSSNYTSISGVPASASGDNYVLEITGTPGNSQAAGSYSGSIQLLFEDKV
ncbi:fimbrial protein [Vibrio sp. ZSDZ65]|uniref:Fimbrial protein n=1 Tax=Vibrio qingdaonensis TaxID=2829491 RepID=A0A9X3CSV5_9VIBR|nr:CS1 type fimbrial major subunit [Vibrio qingdaonensis]MCW8349063.1 fimbrial protein [Vibrio qingdaonensis]